MKKDFYNIYIVGVGGQGVLTIADIITTVAAKLDIPVNYFPTKGMAQRGGFVKAQLRLGREVVGPDISEQGADLIISMELSETLKAVKYLKEGGDYLIYGSKWEPAAVMLGNAPYPEKEIIINEIKAVKGNAIFLDDKLRPEYNGKLVRENLFVLGGIMQSTSLRKIFSVDDVIEGIKEKWPKGVEENIYTFNEGLKSEIEM